MENEITVTAHGRLLKMETLGLAGKRGGGKRSNVTVFSSASRFRLLQKFATVKGNGLKSVFLTLTYGQAFPSPSEAKRHLDNFLKRIRRHYENVSGIWRMEFQKRGAPHFHIILFNLPFVPKTVIKRWWGKVVGMEFWDYSTETPTQPFTRIEFLRSHTHASRYVSKYVAKVDGSDCGFNIAAYLTENGSFLHPVTGEDSGSIGRWWGVFNADNLPLALKVEIALNGYGATIIDTFKRALAAIRWRINPHTRTGFTSFEDNPYTWADYIQELSEIS